MSRRAFLPFVILLLLLPCCDALGQSQYDMLAVRERIGQGHLEEAYDLCLHLRTLNPQDPGLNRLLVECASYGGWLNRPDSLFRQEIRDGRNLPYAYYGEGLVKYYEKEYGRTITLLSQALELGIRTPEVMQALVSSYERTYGAEQSRRYFSILCHRNPESAIDWYALALVSWGVENSTVIINAIEHAKHLNSAEPRYEQARIAAEAAFEPTRTTATELAKAIRAADLHGDVDGWCFLSVARVLMLQESGQDSLAVRILREILSKSTKLGLKRWEGWASLKVAEQMVFRGELTAAKSFAHQSYDAAQASQDQMLEINSMTRLAEICLDLGELEESIHYGIARLRLAEHGEFEEEILHGVIDLSRSLIAGGFTQTAIDLLTSVLGRNFAKQIAPFGLVRLYTTLGMANIAVGKCDEAGDNFKQAEHATKRAKISPRILGGLLEQEAKLAMAMGNSKHALTLFRKQFEVGVQIHDVRIQASAKVGLGDVALLMGKRKEALKCYTQIVPFLRSSGLHEELIQCLRGIAKVNASNGNLSRALSNSQELLSLDYTALPFRTQPYSGRSRADYERYIGLLVKSGKVREAFGILDLLHRREQEDALFWNRNSDPPQSNQDKVDRNESLRNALLTIYRSMASRKSEGLRITHQNEDLSDLMQVLEAEIEFSQDTEKSLPFMALHGVDTLSSTILNLKNRLSANASCLIEYLIGEEDSYLFFVSGDSLAVFDLGVPRAEVERHVSALSPVLDPLHESQGAWNRLLAEFDGDERKILFEMILKPAYPSMRTFLSVEIVADGPLRNLPFEVLTTDTTSLEDLSPSHDTRYLQKDILYKLWSSQSPTSDSDGDRERKLLVCTSSNGSRSNELSPFEDEYIEADRKGILPPIPGAADESQQIGDYIGRGGDAEVLLVDGNNWRLRSKGASILHFASHSIWNSHVPIYSSLDFQNSEGIRQIVWAFDLVELPDGLDFVVLNGCSTARWSIDGRSHGFVRALMNGKARAVIGTLWPVEDGIARALILNFYEYVGKGYSISESLRLAKQSIISSGRRDPFAWAGFVVLGSDFQLMNKEKTGLNQSVNWVEKGGGILLVIMIAGWLARRSLKLRNIKG
jgi:tetratricopeptide (TPR) repeat protein